MALSYIWWYISSSGDLGCVEYLFTAITPGPLWPGVVVPVRVAYMDQINLLKLFVFDENTW